jgi:hypothetical protein
MMLMAFDPPLMPLAKLSPEIAYSWGATVVRIGRPVADSIVNFAAQV